MTLFFQGFRGHHFRTSSLVVLLCEVMLLKNEPITRISQRHLPMKTRQTNSKAKHQTTYSVRGRICKSTPGRISLELFRGCGCPPPLPCIFVVSGRITMKFYTGVDNHRITSNIKKDFQKSNDVIKLKTLLLCRKMQKKFMKNTCVTCYLMAVSQ